jgi:LPS sulfotransferase NodH
VTRQVTTRRPDILSLVGPEYDRPSPRRAERTLIICSAPRTGSLELCRYLLAAGVGVPHEYFNPNYALRLGARWAFANNPLEPSELSRYIEALRQRRANNGVFATKLQFPQFDRILRNRHGRELFEGATIVHLFRPDPAAQYASYRRALESGVWDFSGQPTTPPVVRDPTDFNHFFKQALQELDSLMGEDAGFRCMFALLGIRPLFVTTDELFREPRHIVRKIATALGVVANEDDLGHAIEQSVPYSGNRETGTSTLAEHFKRVVFREP